MIRFRRLPTALLDAWLVSQTVPTSSPRYRLRLWREDRNSFEALRNELDLYFAEAFEDARRRLRRGFEDALSPFADPDVEPASNYPQLLHRVTLQGYLGEILAVLAVEHWGAHGSNDWVVPAFLFRFHNQEFQHLEMINERIRAGQGHSPDENSQLRPGRTGDDGLAFRIDHNGGITHVLTLEAKCLSANDARKIAEAHQKLSAAGILPPSILELINILSDYDTVEADNWQQALITLRANPGRAARLDGVAYACGRIPTRPRITWLPADRPPADYAIQRKLEGMEFQFADLRGIIELLYRDR
jgi:hypothetical protein